MTRPQALPLAPVDRDGSARRTPAKCAARVPSASARRTGIRGWQAVALVYVVTVLFLISVPAALCAVALRLTFDGAVCAGRSGKQLAAAVQRSARQIRIFLAYHRLD